MEIVPSLLTKFTFGLTLGLSSAVIPGPFMSVVVTQTIKHGFFSGMLVALSIFLTDIVFIGMTVAGLAIFGSNDIVLGVISIIGSFYLLKLAYENLTVDVQDIEVETDTSTKALLKGALVLFLSPGPYIFWITVAGPTLAESYRQSILLPIAFLAGIYLSFVGAHVVIAGIVARSREFFKSSNYRYLLRGVGVALIVFSVLLLRDGVLKVM
jgi:threonine/homoserine/homoserine lactone efflux protein